MTKLTDNLGEVTLFETERLYARHLTIQDAPFVFRLVNEPAWLKNIGDKQVHSLADAEKYLINGPIKSYQENHFGLYWIGLKSTHKPIGMCGLVKRDGLDFPDIGFALMPEFWGQGLASEIARQILIYASNEFNIPCVLGITSSHNTASMNVLEKIGLVFDKMITLPGETEEICLYKPDT